ncbi:MAG: hypothetical protein JNK89_03725, partial [Saprospiraceae bacterium]|nr:hypothetical protein [Saprospiraceae bacterium]
MQIQLFAILLLLQGFSTCHPAQEPPGALAAGLNFSPAAPAEKKLPEITRLAYQSDDSGATWQDISAGLPADFQTTCMIVVEGTVYLGSEKGLYQHRRYCNAGRQWEPELLLQDRVTNLCPSRSGFYTCNYGQGIFQNVMGMGIWAPTTASLEDKTVHTILEIDGGLLVGTDNGIFKSADGGRTWKQVFTGKMIVELVAAGKVLLGGGL